MKNRLLLSLTAAATAALLLAGCVPARPGPPPAALEPVAVPSSMEPTQRAVSLDPAIVPGDGRLPWIMGGSVAEPGEGAKPVVWSSPDGGSWAGFSVDPGFAGSFYGELAGSKQISALAGVHWESGVVRTVLWTSTDRSNWGKVGLPDEFASHYLTLDVAVSGSTIVLIGRRADGEVKGIRISSDETELFDLPSVSTGKRLSPSIIVARDRQLVLVASPGKEGAPSETVSYLSPDLGETWGRPTVLVGELGAVDGVTVADDGFVATGAAPRTGGDPVTRPGAWFSADGARWVRENVPSPPDGGPLFYSKTINAKLGAPVAHSGLTMAVLQNYNAAVSGVYQRSAGGEWAFAGETGVNPDAGVGGFAASINGTDAVAVIGAGDYRRIGVLLPDGWVELRALSEREDVASPVALTTGGRSLLTLRTTRFAATKDLNWRRTTTVGLSALKHGALAEVPWAPKEASELHGARVASDEAGAELTLGLTSDGGTLVVSGFFRPSADAAWTAVTGFETSGSTTISSVAKIGDTWIMTGKRAENIWSRQVQGVIWTSLDGNNWSKASLDLDADAFASGVSGACSLPDGTGVAVGWAEETAGRTQPAVWLQSSDSWIGANLTGLESTDGWIGACATGEDGLVATGNVAGHATLLFSADGSDWTKTFRADHGTELANPVAVNGGFAASGSLRQGQFAGPVIWLSPNGKQWSAFSVPSFDIGATLAVAPSGDDLIVTMDARSGHPVSIVRDIRALMPEESPARGRVDRAVP